MIFSAKFTDKLENTGAKVHKIRNQNKKEIQTFSALVYQKISQTKKSKFYLDQVEESSLKKITTQKN